MNENISIYICNPKTCEHQWDGWIGKVDGGTAVCVKCGMEFDTWMMFNL